MDKRNPCPDFTFRGYFDGNYAQENTSNIISHQGNANYTTMGYHYTPIRMAKIKKWQTPSADKNVQTLDHLFIAVGK